MGRLSKRERGKKRREGGRKGFQEVKVTYNIKIHSSCGIKDLVETHICKIVCDTPIARIYHRCRGLLYALC